VKTSSDCSRSVMRPEYIAEFEEAGVDPYSSVTLTDRLETLPEPAKNIQRPRTRKVILSQPQRSNNDGLASNDGGGAAGLLWILVIVTFFPLIIMVGIARAAMAVKRGGGRRRRRRW
jgi:hypothetical protein